MSEKFPIRNNPNTGPEAGTAARTWSSSCYCYKNWPKEVNIVVMECYYRSKPIDDNGVPLKGYQQRMYRKWLQQGASGNAIEQRICDQARAIRRNGWLA